MCRTSGEHGTRAKESRPSSSPTQHISQKSLSLVITNQYLPETPPAAENGLDATRTNEAQDDGYKSDLSASPQNHSNPFGSTTGENMRIPACIHIDPTGITCLTSAMKHPPVTAETLKELDLQWIMNNISLRVDVNYDHDLHFMPVTGEKAVEKRRNAQEYWTALAIELQVYLHDTRSCPTCVANGGKGQFEVPARLPRMFAGLQALLLSLVPDRDFEQVHEHLDVKFLMQQVRHGVFDAARMSSWLAQLLTTHCAPMRDEWAEEMSAMIQKGASDASMKTLVDGLEKLFSFLEAMKLDVANHQIRTLKYILIDETITFQQNYFQRRLLNGKLSVDSSKAWYQRSYESLKIKNSPSEEQAPSNALTIFLHGLVSLCRPNDYGEQIPVAFAYDSDRIKRLREDVLDLVYLKLCLALFEKLVCELVGTVAIPTALTAQLQQRILVITDCEPETTIDQTWFDHLDAVSMEITTHAHRVSWHSGKSISHQPFAVSRNLLLQYFDSSSEQFTATLAATINELKITSILRAGAFFPLQPLQLSELQRRWQKHRQLATQHREIPEIEDMARRVAHMGVLHWRIWADMVYLPVYQKLAHATGEDETFLFEAFLGNLEPGEGWLDADQIPQCDRDWDGVPIDMDESVEDINWSGETGNGRDDGYLPNRNEGL